ncbi:DnaJ domain-containing protein [Paracidovorax citrulli]
MTASQEDIRLAYRRLAMRWHPDRNPDNAGAAEERFKRIQHAFAALKDPARRSAYDAERSAPRGGQGAAGEAGRTGPRAWQHAGPKPRAGSAGARAYANAYAGNNAGNNAGTGSAKGKPGADYVCETSIPLETAVLGGTATTRVRAAVDCLRCEGSGMRPRACNHCGGSGQIRRGLFNGQSMCNHCGGRGNEPHPCDHCAGTGKIRVNKVLQVQIRPGVIDGTVLRAKGMGGPGLHGGANGNLLCRVHVRKDRVFGVDGLDLTRELRIDFVLACLGGKVGVPRFRQTVTAEIPAMTRAGTVIRLAGQGLYDRAHQRTGDLVLTVAIDLPTRMRPLSDRQQALLREMGPGGML